MNKATMNNFDYKTGIGSFTVQNVISLDLLPKMSIKGKENLSTISSTGFGSKAFVIDGSKRYILNSDNEWQEVQDSSGSSSGGGGTDPNWTYTNTDDIDEMFKQ